MKSSKYVQSIQGVHLLECEIDEQDSYSLVSTSCSPCANEAASPEVSCKFSKLKRLARRSTILNQQNHELAPITPHHTAISSFILQKQHALFSTTSQHCTATAPLQISLNPSALRPKSLKIKTRIPTPATLTCKEGSSGLGLLDSPQNLPKHIETNNPNKIPSKRKKQSGSFFSACFLPIVSSDDENEESESASSTSESTRKEYEISSRFLNPMRAMSLVRRLSKLNVDDILRDKEMIKYFQMFTENEHSSENVLFWIAVSEYRSIQGEDERRAKIDEIYYRFLDNTSPLQINTSQKLLKQLYKDIEMSGAHIDIFDPMVFDLEIGVLNDSYSRFKKSPLYIKMCEELKKKKKCK